MKAEAPPGSHDVREAAVLPTTATITLYEPPAEPESAIFVEIAVGPYIATGVACVWTDKNKPTCGGLCRKEACNFTSGTCLRGYPRQFPDHSLSALTSPGPC